MKVKILELIILLLIFMPFRMNYWLMGQTDHHVPGCPVSIKKMLEDPAFMEDYQAFNDYIKRLADNSLEKSLDKRIVPVVFHIIHRGSNLGQNENLSNAQIQQIMQTINKVFSKQANNINTLPLRFDTIAGNANIEFRLARRDPLGNCTDGIRRVYSPTKSIDVYGDVNFKNYSYWDRSKYLNIWIVNNIQSPFESTTGGTILGYALFPGTAPALQDGCTIAAGAALTQAVVPHEIGHHLNLIHIWGDEECGDDEVDDTPIHNDVNFAWANPCTTAIKEATCYDTSWVLAGGDSAVYNFKKHMRFNVGENFQNIMDYVSNYNCPNMFTKGQIQRMRAAMDFYSYRRSVWSEPNLIATGVADNSPACSPAPIPEFWATKKFVCVGESVSFRDGSFNATPTSWQWEFPGGTPATSTQQNPTGITYSAPGAYPVNLTVSNSVGGNSLTKQGVVYVGYPETKVRSFGYSEGFEYGEDFEMGRWTSYTEPENVSARWEHTCATSYSGSCALKLNNFFSNDRGQMAYLISPSYNLNAIQLSTGESLRLRFRYAYALNQSLPVGANPNFMDALRILYSKNCGSSWQAVKNITKNELITAGISPSLYTPNDKIEWYLIDINLPNAAKGDNVRFMFEFSAGISIGNNLYLDDIEIVGAQQISAPEFESDHFSIALQPNPASTHADLALNLTRPVQEFRVEIFDLSGRVVKSMSRQKLLEGLHIIGIDKEDYMRSGLYFIRMSLDGSIVTKKLIFQ